MAMQTIDPNQIDLVFASIKLNEGIGDGTYIEVTPDVDLYATKVGVDGRVVRLPIYNEQAVVKVTLMQTSHVNLRLSALVAADRASRKAGTGGTSVGSLQLIDRGGTTVVSASKAWPKKLPTLTYSAEPETVDWEFTLADMTMIVGDNPDE